MCLARRSRARTDDILKPKHLITQVKLKCQTSPFFKSSNRATGHVCSGMTTENVRTESADNRHVTCQICRAFSFKDELTTFISLQTRLRCIVK